MPSMLCHYALQGTSDHHSPSQGVRHEHGVASSETTPHTPSVETVTMEARLGAVGRATALHAGRYKYQGAPRGLALTDATYVVARRANLGVESDIVQAQAAQGTT